MRLPLLILHILGGTLGLIAGTIAMIARKGGQLHRRSGNIFTLAMLTLATSGFWLAILKSQISNVIAAVLTFYLIGSAWLAGRRRDGTGLLDWIGLFLCLASAAGVLTLGVRAVYSSSGTDNGAPAVMSFLFGGILLLAAAGDTRVLAHGGISGRPRIVRHLWRAMQATRDTTVGNTLRISSVCKCRQIKLMTAAAFVNLAALMRMKTHA